MIAFTCEDSNPRDNKYEPSPKGVIPESNEPTYCPTAGESIGLLFSKLLCPTDKEDCS